MSTRVVSIHREAHTVSIMRGYGRKWGNPARLASRDPLDVAACLLAHARHLEKSGLIDDVRELRGEVLVCVCKPARCHGFRSKAARDSQRRPGAMASSSYPDRR